MSYHCSLRSWCSLIRCQVALLRQFPGFHYYIIYKLRQFFLFRSLRYSTVGYTSLRLMWPTVLALLHNILSFISLCLFVSQQCWKRASSRPHRCIVVFEQETWYTRQRYCRFIMWPMDSQWAVMVEEHQCWCCPRWKSLSSRILQDQFTSPYPCPWTTKSSKIIKDFESNSDIVGLSCDLWIHNGLSWSKNTSVDVVLEESPCPPGSSRTNLQVLILVLGP